MSTTEASGATGVWLHAVLAGPAPDAMGLAGIAGTPVRAVPGCGLVAAVSDAPLAEFGEDALRRNLADLSWLARVARAHHAVVDALSRAAAVVPARLATVYRDDARVAEVLAERHDELVGALARLTGRDEWGVKGYAVPGATPRQDDPRDAGGTGTAYLRRRRAELHSREEGQRVTTDAAAAVHTALTRYAVAARRHPPQDRRLSGAAEPMVLNGAYLLDRDGESGFAGLIGTLTDRYPQIRLELTGPWPPYSFVADPEPIREPA
jgi:hypothetical protein